MNTLDCDQITLSERDLSDIAKEADRYYETLVAARASRNLEEFDHSESLKAAMQWDLGLAAMPTRNAWALKYLRATMVDITLIQ